MITTRIAHCVPGDAADRVRFDLDVPACRRRLNPHQCPGRRDHEDAGRTASAAGRDRQASQIDPLVLAADRPPQLHTPHLRRPGAVSQGLERNLHFNGPAAVEPSGPHIPDRVPVAVGIAFVGELLVGARPERVGVEVEPVAAVVERVEEGGERVVLAQLARVAPHLVGDPFALGRRIPHPGRDIYVRVVEHDPGLGLLGRSRPFHRHLLNEVADRGHLLIDRFVERAVDPNPRRQLDSPDRRAPRRVPVHDRGRDRRRRTVDEGQEVVAHASGQRRDHACRSGLGERRPGAAHGGGRGWPGIDRGRRCRWRRQRPCRRLNAERQGQPCHDLVLQVEQNVHFATGLRGPDDRPARQIDEASGDLHGLADPFVLPADDLAAALPATSVERLRQPILCPGQRRAPRRRGDHGGAWREPDRERLGDTDRDPGVGRLTAQVRERNDDDAGRPR